MNSINYEIPENPLPAVLLAPLLRAEDALARIDERARLSPLREGWIARLAFGETCASRLAEGELVHLEDVVLADGGAMQGAGSPELSAALQTLLVLRRAVDADAAALLALPRPGEADADPAAIGEAARQHRQAVPDYFFEADRDEAGRLAAWRRVVREGERLPPLLAAATAWDSWLMLEPEERGAWRAPLLAALVLRKIGKTRTFLLPIDTGRRHAKYRRHPQHGYESRILGFLEWTLAAADRAHKDLDALSLAAQSLERYLAGRRRSSRLPALVQLLLSKPLVSIPMAAKTLGVSQQAVDVMMRQLGSIPRELTGRGRYRVWGV